MREVFEKILECSTITSMPSASNRRVTLVSVSSVGVSIPESGYARPISSHL